MYPSNVNPKSKRSPKTELLSDRSELPLPCVLTYGKTRKRQVQLCLKRGLCRTLCHEIVRTVGITEAVRSVEEIYHNA